MSALPSRLRVLIMVAAVVLWIPSTGLAQGPPMPPPGPPGMGGPPPPGLEGRLFPPELVMRYQREIGLTEAQQKKITKELQALQTKVVELQFSLQKEVGAMTKLLEATAIDEAVTLKQAERVMSVEHEIKQLHLRTLIRIKNALTAEQIAALEKKRPPMGPGPGRGGRP